MKPDGENAQKILQALAEFGFGGLGIRLQDLDVAGKVVQLGVSPNRIDLITSITGVTFEQAWDSREPGELDGVGVYFISRTPLIYNKESTGRAKDLGDAEELRRRGPKE